ncbi:MAG: BlaI/MecI/CopY family transcriptional regulator [Chitinophagaceae bacterium]
MNISKPDISPTKSELEILKVLWKQGPSTVRSVNKILNNDTRDVKYTSTLKLMQIMVEKGLITRNTDSMTHVFTARHEEQIMKADLVDKFVSNLFEGSATKLMMQLMGNQKTSQDELKAIRKLLDELDKA